jgi:acetone carboxylase gamma subunit
VDAGKEVVMGEKIKRESWSKEVLKALVEGTLDAETSRQVQRGLKDEDRFEKMLEIEQERVPWKEKILVPLQEHLYVVQKGDEKIIKCSCGYEYGDYHENWKLRALVYERDPSDGEIFVGPRACDPEWMILREFYCPGCGTQLDVEAVPPGEPFIFNQLPDIDGFYRKKALP